jgi:hypothetical protein
LRRGDSLSNCQKFFAFFFKKEVSCFCIVLNHSAPVEFRHFYAALMRHPADPHRAFMPPRLGSTRRMEALAMMDLFSVVLGVGVLGLMAVYTVLCDRI